MTSRPAGEVGQSAVSREILDQYDFSDTDYMDEHSASFEGLVGRYIIQFSYFESAVDLLIIEHMSTGSHELGYVVVAKMRMADKIDLVARLIELSRHQGLPMGPKVGTLASRCREANTFRNLIAHARWASMDSTGLVRVRTQIDEEHGVWFKKSNLSRSKIDEGLQVLQELLADLDDDLQLVEWDNFGGTAAGSDQQSGAESERESS